MRIVVISDSHRFKSRLYDIIETHLNDADMFAFLGDMDDDFDDALLLYPSIKYIRVAGNNEWGSPYPLFCETIVGGKRLYACHGHTHGVKHGYDALKEHCRLIGADICLFGHTHVQYTDYSDGLYIMNPGAACMGEYGIVDIEKNGIFLNPVKMQ